MKKNVTTLSVFLARRNLEHWWTEELAERMRGLNEWWANRFDPDWIAKRSKPPAHPGSKPQLKVVKRRRS
jgi:hypothetical protein